MDRNQPLVSIVIPVYNGSNYMREAIDSALSQTYKNIEVIVVNDGSNDGGETERIALSYGERIRYVSKANGGVSSALNEGIKNMRGEYFSWLSHDDAYSPDKVRRQVELLRGHSSAAALCSIKMIDKDSRFISSPYLLKNVDKGQVIPWDEALSRLFSEDCFGGCCFLLPVEVFEKCGLFDESLRYVQDFLMWSNLFLEGFDIVYDTEPDVYGRIHGQQLTQRGRDLFQKESIIMSEQIIPRLASIDTKERLLLYRYALYNAKHNNISIVKKAVEQMNKGYSAGFTKMAKLRLLCVYGRIRPVIRKIYNGLFRKI